MSTMAPLPPRVASRMTLHVVAPDFVSPLSTSQRMVRYPRPSAMRTTARSYEPYGGRSRGSISRPSTRSIATSLAWIWCRTSAALSTASSTWPIVWLAMGKPRMDRTPAIGARRMIAPLMRNVAVAFIERSVLAIRAHRSTIHPSSNVSATHGRARDPCVTTSDARASSGAHPKRARQSTRAAARFRGCNRTAPLPVERPSNGRRWWAKCSSFTPGTFIPGPTARGGAFPLASSSVRG